MATVGTLFVNIAARTQPFITGVRNAIGNARNAARSGSGVLAAYGQTTRSMLTGAMGFTLFSRMAAAVHGVNPALGMAMFRMQRFGMSAMTVGKNLYGSFLSLGKFLRFGWIGTVLSVGALTGMFLTRITKLAVGRYKEIRESLYSIQRAWRTVELQGSRAFAPAVKAFLDVVNMRMQDYFGETGESMKAVAQVAIVIASVLITIADIVRIIWNLFTGLFRVVMGVGSYITGIVGYLTDAVGLTEGLGDVGFDMGNDSMKAAWGDAKDMGNAVVSNFHMWDRMAQGMGDVQQGPTNLSETGYGGSGMLVDEARKQNQQLARIEKAILASGGLN